MTRVFLRSKHWQLFILTTGIPIVFQLLLIGIMFSNFGSESNSSSPFLFDYFNFFLFLFIIPISLLYGWLWSIAIGLQYKVPENIKMKVNKFKIFFFTPLVYMVYFFSSFQFSNEIIESNTILLTLMIALHFFSMFCMIYILYFVAKTYKTVELQREVNFSDFAGEFFMIWFYPVGIWILQPKINKMVEK